MQVVLSVLNLLYVFSKRSNYITRLGSDKRTPLLARLQHLAEVPYRWQNENMLSDILMKTCLLMLFFCMSMLNRLNFDNE